MANVIKTVKTYTLDGTTKEFDIPFEYLARKFVVITLIGVDRKVLVINTDYKFPTKTRIATTKAWGPADGYQLIEIRRFTSATDRLVDFNDGSILRAYDLNVAQIQTLHVAEEARDLTADTIGVNNDGNLDARGRRIVNVANGVQPGDAITLGQVTTWNTSALNSANKAATSEKNAKTSETNSKSSETLAQKWAANPVDVVVANNQYSAFHYSSKAIGAAAAAVTSETNAKTAAANATTQAGNSKTSADAAKASQTAAAASATASADSASDAKTEADRAKTEADKLGNMNKFAGMLEYPTDGTVRINGKVQGTGSNPSFDSLANRTNSANYFRFWDTYDNARMGYFGYGGVTDIMTFVNDRIPGIDTDKDCSFQFAGGVYANTRKGAGSYAKQYDVAAPFFHEFSSSSGSEYNPLIKQTIHSSAGTAWSTSWSLGTLVNTGVPEFKIFNIDSNGGARQWSFNNDGSTHCPGNLSLSGGAGTALYTVQGNITGNIFDSGSLNGEIRALVDYLQRGGQVYSAGSGNGNGRSWEAPAGCYMTGINTNVSDGRGMGVYYRSLQFRRRGGSLQNIGG